MEKLSNRSLRESLWKMAKKAEEGKISPIVARAATNAHREILRSISIDLQILRLAGVRPDRNMLSQIVSEQAPVGRATSSDQKRAD